MPVSDIRKTVLEIVNATERKLGYTESSALGQTKFTNVLLDYLNEVVADMNAAGDWAELRRVVVATASSSTDEYWITHTEQIDHIYEVAISGRIAPLTNVSVSEIQQLGRLNSFGTPSQFAIVSANTSGNPVMSVWPVPNTAVAGNLFSISIIEKVQLYATADGATVVPFPANTLMIGLHAKALLEESGGEPTRQWEVRSREYERAKQQDINRYTTDTGHDVKFRPSRRSW